MSNYKQADILIEIYRLHGDIKVKIRIIEQNLRVMRRISNDSAPRSETNAKWEEINQYKNANNQLFQEINRLFQEIMSQIPQSDYQTNFKEQIQ